MNDYYIFSALDWFHAQAPDNMTIIASCAIIGDHIGVINDAQTLIIPPYPGKWWYTKELRKSKAQVIDSVSSIDIYNCLLSIEPLTNGISSGLIIQKAKEMAKGLLYERLSYH